MIRALNIIPLIAGTLCGCLPWRTVIMPQSGSPKYTIVSNRTCDFPVFGKILAVTPSKSFAYSAIGGEMPPTSMINQFRYGTGGRLVPIGMPVRTGAPIGSMIVPPKGQFLYVILQSGEIDLYRISKNGLISLDTAFQVPGTFEINRLSDGTVVNAGPGSDGSLEFSASGARAHLTHEEGFMDHSRSVSVKYAVLRNGHFRKTSGHITTTSNGQTFVHSVRLHSQEVQSMNFAA